MIYRLAALGTALVLVSACGRQASPDDIQSAMQSCGVPHGQIEPGNEPDEGQSDYRLDLGASTEEESQCINDRLEAEGFEPIMIVSDGSVGHEH